MYGIRGRDHLEDQREGPCRESEGGDHLEDQREGA